MKTTKSILIAFVLCVIFHFPTMAQDACGENGVEIEVSSFQFTPSSVNIPIGQTVSWVNYGGFHNSQGTTSSITGESFNNPATWDFAPVSGNSSGVCIGAMIFTVPGVYQYDCSVGSHALAGMVGEIIVGTGGCLNPDADNFDPNAEFDDGSCVLDGCTDPTACNFNPDATTDDGSCLEVCSGCTYEAACNYDPLASSDDGSCTFPGCQNSDALNFDPNAGCAGVCEYTPCPGDFNNDWIINAADLLGFLAVFGTFCE